MNIDRESFVVCIVFGAAVHLVLTFLKAFFGAAWRDFKCWRLRRKQRSEGFYRWESVPDPINCRCSVTPLDDFDDTTPTEGPMR